MSKLHFIPRLAISALMLHLPSVAGRVLVHSHGVHDAVEPSTENPPFLSRRLYSGRRYRMFKDGKLSKTYLVDGDAEVEQEDRAVDIPGTMSETEAKTLGKWFMEHVPDVDEDPEAMRLGEWFRDNLSVNYVAEQELLGQVAGGEVDEEVNAVEADGEEQVELIDENIAIEIEDQEGSVSNIDTDCIEPRIVPGIFRKRKLRRRNLGGKSGGKASKSAHAYQLFHAHIQPVREDNMPGSTIASPVATVYPELNYESDGYYYEVVATDYGGKSKKSAKKSYNYAKSAKSKAGKGSKSGDISTDIPITTGTPSVRCTKSPTFKPSSYIVSTISPSEIDTTKTGTPSMNVAVTASPIITAPPTGSPVAIPTTASPSIAGGTASMAPTPTPVLSTATPISASPTSSSPVSGTLQPASSSPVGVVTIPPASASPVTSSPTTSIPVTGTFTPTTLIPIGGTLPPTSLSPIGGTSPPTTLVPATPTTISPSLVPPTSSPPTVPLGPSTLLPGTSAPSIIGVTVSPNTLLPSTASPSIIGASDAPSTIPSTLVLGTLPPSSTSATSSPSTLGEPTTSAPTQEPIDSTYYRGFEQGDFPFVIESTDPTWTTENSLDSSLVWQLSNEKANSGKYSIKSPIIENDAATSGSANATLTTSDLGPGTLYFSIYAGVQMPIDAVGWFVDGEFREGVEAMTTFEQKSMTVGPGAHVYQFVYTYNPGSFPAENLPPDDVLPDRTGAVYIDDVYFVPLTVTKTLFTP